MSSEASIDAVTRTRVDRFYGDGRQHNTTDHVSTEQPLELRIRGESIAITMRTPGHDFELAAGFAVSEGLIRNPGQFLEIAHCRREESEHPENIVNLYLDAECDIRSLSRHVYASSSCGICGKASLEAIRSQWPAVDSELRVSADRLWSLPQRLHEAQKEFQRTGGLHAAALFDRHGTLLCLREDVGRHNAVDKVIGWSFLNDRYPLVNSLLLVSGRASFEIMQKALAARIPLVAAISAPSSLAVACARENRQTLIGFLRDGRFNAYSEPERILTSKPSDSGGGCA